MRGGEPEGMRGQQGDVSSFDSLCVFLKNGKYILLTFDARMNSNEQKWNAPYARSCVFRVLIVCIRFIGTAFRRLWMLVRVRGVNSFILILFRVKSKNKNYHTA